MSQLDRVFGDMNPVLIALVIGLAALDFSCFTVLRTVGAIQASMASGTVQDGVVALTSSNHQTFRW